MMMKLSLRMFARRSRPSRVTRRAHEMFLVQMGGEGECFLIRYLVLVAKVK